MNVYINILTENSIKNLVNILKQPAHDEYRYFYYISVHESMQGNMYIYEMIVSLRNSQPMTSHNLIRQLSHKCGS